MGMRHRQNVPLFWNFESKGLFSLDFEKFSEGAPNHVPSQFQLLFMSLGKRERITKKKEEKDKRIEIIFWGIKMNIKNGTTAGTNVRKAHFLISD